MGSIGGEEAMQQGHEERILVSVRLRPLNDKELARKDVSEWECTNDTTIICRNNLSASDRSLYPTAYSFDRVFRGDCSTRQVYEEAAKEVALSVVSGINSSIFAYGQTSSGKTHTMSGITEYAVEDIYNYIYKHPERQFVLKFSAIEIYNESVRDLLSADSSPLRLLDDPERGTVIEKLTEETLRDWNHFTELIAFCETQRQIGETTLNDASSRSHQILRLTIESSALEFRGNDKSSSLAASVNFVDLAGSERVSQTNSAGTRLKEGCHINRSLLTLGTVIRKLSKGRNGHIPFRDSKLTRILQSSLGGNAKTAIICTMSPARSHVEQTRNTLLFASCAKEVATSAQVNVVVSDKALVKQLQKEVSRLETELRISATPHPISDSTALLREKDREIEMLKKEVRELMLKLDRAQSQMKDMAQVAEDDVESMDLQYPRLRVRNTWDFENQSDEPNILSDGVESIRSFHASQYSDGHSISSDENLFQLPDLEKNLPIRIASPGISIASTDAVSNDLDQKSVDDEHEGEHCKDVRCIESEDMIANTHTHSNQADLSPKNTYTNSNTANFRLTVVDNGDKKNMDLSPSELKEDKKLDHSRQGFALPSTETISPWMSRYSSFSCKTLKLSRSRSCKGSLMKSSSSDWFDMEEIMQNTPEMGDEKDFSIRPGGFQRKVYTLNYNANVERKSLDSYINFVGGAQIAESSTNKETESNGPNGDARQNGSFNLTIESSALEFRGNDKSSSLAASVNFVDLAGSERVSQTNSAGTRLKEGCHINRSLLTLGTVIRKLSKGRNGHIPFRDSKLTRILQSSLGGNARSAIICTMSPARSHVEQTRNTLLFACCAKEVATNAQVNVVVSDKALVKQLQKEVSRLESELRNSWTPRPISDSTVLLREKDREIEMLKKEVQELTLKLDRAQSQIKDMAQVVEDDVESMDLQYPKLRVRNTWDFENQSDEPNVLSDGEESIRSFHASQYSDGHSISSDENLFQLPDLEKNLPIRSASPGLSVASSDAISNDFDQKNIDDQHEEEHCKEVRCIESEDVITNTQTHSNQADLSPNNTYTDSNTSSPAVNTANSELTDNGDKKNMDLTSSELKEDKRLDHLRQDFAFPSTENISPWLTRYSSFNYRTMNLSRSRSCKENLMKSSSSDWFEMEEIMQSTPQMGDEKDFPGRPERFQRKFYALNYNANPERQSLDSYISFVGDAQNVESSTNKESESNGELASRGKANKTSLNLMTDHEVTEKGTNPIIITTKEFKDVGLDPMQADIENHSNWPSEFKRLQREIVELWDACNISLIHRTYFFLLFKGDPSDSIYMEVELRRLSYIKQTFSQGNQIVESGLTLTPDSSIRNLRRERQMLSKQIQRRLSKSERENLYLKWGLRLSSKHRRLQLSHRLWSETKDMEHARESAEIVAKLVGSVEPHRAFKEMFGLNFAPRPTSKKSFGWTASMKNILL
ncbi:hypothetical protein TanjilG_22836 [Lupinus angustifolius]|uniref:Kinesin motor domain-containing protein n=1 Tax=Lupinus angustifolius TaxID=3871 RepID=A0A4P1RHZ3_LUPAN|nr:hypothetical protein TanjilG_22836 [Lupinus angustifolius]